MQLGEHTLAAYLSIVGREKGRCTLVDLRAQAQNDLSKLGDTLIGQPLIIHSFVPGKRSNKIPNDMAGKFTLRSFVGSTMLQYDGLSFGAIPRRNRSLPMLDPVTLEPLLKIIIVDQL